ncbi:uncharacterized protein LOC133192013 [Saccostrea echinata]|uniref:uncharacterized protein LOC133192013 n=1 Tax=Saccostrea echinata TaxID=191078 RepID=UPI002A83EC2B|nr:uncharacterized protein LOC133192013 [Saccostrea echinata]
MVKLLENKAQFDSVIAEGKLTVVDFYATWCGPCRMIAPKIEEMEKENPDVNFVKVDVDENSETAEACGISAMPTFHFYKNGEKLDEVVGADEGKLRECVAKFK